MAGNAGLARARGDLARDRSAQRRALQALAADDDRAGRPHARVEAQRLEHERRAGHELRPGRVAQGDRQRAGVAHVAEHDERRPADAAVPGQRGEQLAVVGCPATRRREQHDLRARGGRRGHPLRRERRGGVELDECRAAVLDEREAVTGLAAERGQQRLDRPAAAAGDRAQLGRRRHAGALQPARDRRGDDGRAQLPAECLGRDQDRGAARHRA